MNPSAPSWRQKAKGKTRFRRLCPRRRRPRPSTARFSGAHMRRSDAGTSFLRRVFSTSRPLPTETSGLRQKGRWLCWRNKDAGGDGLGMPPLVQNVAPWHGVSTQNTVSFCLVSSPNPLQRNKKAIKPSSCRQHPQCQGHMACPEGSPWFNPKLGSDRSDHVK